MFCIYELMTFSPSSPKYHELHTTPISGCSVAAGRHQKDRKFSVSIGSEEFPIMKFLDAYSSITNISPLHFWLPTSSTSPKNPAPAGLAGCLLTSVLLHSNTSRLLQIFHGQVLSHPVQNRANCSLQFRSLSQSSRTCRRGILSLREERLPDPGIFFPSGLQISTS